MVPLMLCLGGRSRRMAISATARLMTQAAPMSTIVVVTSGSPAMSPTVTNTRNWVPAPMPIA